MIPRSSHKATIRDFVALCDDLGITIEQGYTYTGGGKLVPSGSSLWRANVFGDQGLFVLSYDDDARVAADGVGDSPAT